ncbi:CD209 antigen-like protein E [Mytilus edulis]|uniref:CD209 antigen-like protein E n=1 Tax=Mytilus edulis TaxID=6550 RepID=UPI0039EE161C
MFGTTKGDTNSCFEFCYFTEQCNMIIESECCCYASDFPTIDTYYFTMSSSNQNKVWLKRPVHVCDVPGFIYYNEVCFKIFEENTKTWGDAKQECELLGGRLIVLNSEYKHNTTVEALHNFSPNPYTGQYFVGATDIGSEDTWRWVDEQSIGSATYMKFHGNNPNNYDFHYPGEDANCGVLKMRHDGMVDDYCLQEKGFICEYVKGLP